MNEIKLLKCLKHPYIASFHGVLQDLSRVYLLQELVPGGVALQLCYFYLDQCCQVNCSSTWNKEM